MKSCTSIVCVLALSMLSVVDAGAQTTQPGAESGAGKAGSQASSGSSGSSGSGDAFVECRNDIAKAKEAYREKRISKNEFDEQKRMAQAKLKSSGQRSAAEKNLECD